MQLSLESSSKKIANIVLFISSLFALYTSGFGFLSAMTQRSIHWLLMVVPIFLLFPTRGKKAKIAWYDILLALIAIGATLYVTLTWEKNALRIDDPTLFDTIVCIVGLLIVLEATRRSVGAAMPIIALIFLLYMYFGPYLPGFFQHKGFSVQSLASFIYTTTEGVFGLAMGVSATYIIIFVLFGAFLAKSGAGQLFVDLSMAVSGKNKYAPVRATIISNALMGIISGSPVANVVTTGAFAIPLLDKAKYPKTKGAALVAAASVGSMFTPPVMGAAAFIIADYLGVSYGKVILAALFPALLYYISLIVAGDIGADKGNQSNLDERDVLNIKKEIREKGQMLLPVILLVALIVSGWSATKSAFWCIVLIIALSFVRKSTRMSGKSIVEALLSGSKDAMPIAAACACAGIIVGVVSATGIGVKFSSLLLQLSGNNVLFSLVLTMIAALILGMGLPPTAVYIILAALTVPALIKLGLHPMAAHFFVFYFSCVGAITPPVALAAYSASAIAKTDPWKTGWLAFRFGLVAYIIPFIFAYNPILLLQGNQNIFITLLDLLCAIMGIVFLNYAIEGYFKRPISLVVRGVFLVGSLFLMVPGFTNDILGIALIIIGYLINKYLYKNGQRQSRA